LEKRSKKITVGFSNSVEEFAAKEKLDYEKSNI